MQESGIYFSELQMCENRSPNNEYLEQQSHDDWRSLITNLFPIAIPNSANWTAADEIISVLNYIARTAPLNHMFFPIGGGADLKGAERHIEPDTISLEEGGPSIVKPTSLTFEYFGNNYTEFAYFRLETDGLEPSGVYEDSDRPCEEVAELEPGQYANSNVFDTGYYGQDENGSERELPQGARRITRYFKGAFVIVGKFSRYNQQSDTYDGRHNTMSAEKFRRYMKQLADGHL